MSTSTYHHGDLRAALLRAAGEILETEGLGALTLREMARRTGVSHNAPYRHFPDRDSLLAALAAQGYAAFAASLQKRPRSEMGEAYVQFALEQPQRFRLMFGGTLRVGDRRVYEALKDSFADLGEGAEYAAAAAWALVHASGVHATVAGVVLGFTDHDVTFVPDGQKKTRVEVEHTHFVEGGAVEAAKYDHFGAVCREDRGVACPSGGGRARHRGGRPRPGDQV